MAPRSLIHPSSPVIKHSQQAFAQAIAAGRLSADSDSPLYFKKYQYMGTWTGRDAFKHLETGLYLNDEEVFDVTLDASLNAKLEEMAKTDGHQPSEFLCLLIEREWDRQSERRRMTDANR